MNFECRMSKEGILSVLKKLSEATSTIRQSSIVNRHSMLFYTWVSPGKTALNYMLILWLALPVMIGCQRQAPEHSVIVSAADRVKIRLAAVDNGAVHFFTYKHGGKNINFFVRTDGTGKLQAHFDACYSCFKYKLGYVREGNQVVCIACRIGYNLDDVVWDYVGACAPINLKSGIAGKHLVIERSRLEKGQRFF